MPGQKKQLLPVEVFERGEKIMERPCGEVMFFVRGSSFSATIKRPFNRFRIRKFLVEEGHLTTQFDVRYDPSINSGTITVGNDKSVIGTFRLARD